MEGNVVPNEVEESVFDLMIFYKRVFGEGCPKEMYEVVQVENAIKVLEDELQRVKERF